MTRIKTGLCVSFALVFTLVAAGCNRMEAERESATPPATPAGMLGGEELVSALRGGGFVMYMRHAATDPQPDDDDPVDFSDCGTQRNLSNAGRRDARAIGRAVDALEIPIGTVLASPFCRTLDTARLAFGKATRTPALEYLETARTDAEVAARTRSLRRLLSDPPRRRTNTVLVAHVVNLTEAAKVNLSEGETGVFLPNAGGFALVARVTPQEWEDLAEQ